MHSVTSTATIQTLRGIFARFGIPNKLVTDNGPQLTSAEFTHFLARNGIKYIIIAPHHPSSNGQAERYVQMFKLGYKAAQGNASQKIANFLLQYRNAPHATTKLLPAQIMLGRPLQARLNSITPKEPQKDKLQRNESTTQIHFFTRERCLVPQLKKWDQGKTRHGNGSCRECNV